MYNSECPLSEHGIVFSGYLLRKATSSDENRLYANETRFDLENAPLANLTKEGVCIHKGGSDVTTPFPPGDYCVYKYNEYACPLGFDFAILVSNQGTILRKDEAPIIHEGIIF